ncbi:hypothetical protein [Aeoliella mucimassa]|nr:hypothetical protein [Aeoliella mucimassa]
MLALLVVSNKLHRFSDGSNEIDRDLDAIPFQGPHYALTIRPNNI